MLCVLTPPKSFFPLHAYLFKKDRMKDEKGKLFRKSLSRTDHISSYLVNEGKQTLW